MYDTATIFVGVVLLALSGIALNFLCALLSTGSRHGPKVRRVGNLWQATKEPIIDKQES